MRKIIFKFKRIDIDKNNFKYQWTVNHIDDCFFCGNLFEIQHIIKSFTFNGSIVEVYRDGEYLQSKNEGLAP